MPYYRVVISAENGNYITLISIVKHASTIEELFEWLEKNIYDFLSQKFEEFYISKVEEIN